MFKSLLVRTALLIGPKAVSLGDGQYAFHPRPVHIWAARLMLGKSLIAGKTHTANDNQFVWQGLHPAAYRAIGSLSDDARQIYGSTSNIFLSQLEPAQCARMLIQLQLGHPAFSFCDQDAKASKQSIASQRLAVDIEKLLCLRDPYEPRLLARSPADTVRRIAEAQPT